MFKLEQNTSYINSGNYFSKSLILKENVKKLKSTLLLVESEKDIETYAKILDYLFMPYKKLDNLSNIVDLLLNKEGFFIGSTELIERQFKDIEQIKYESLYFKKGESIDIEDAIKKLVSLSFKFSEYLVGGSYRKSGDILSIVSPDSKTRYDISFWGNSIEEITKTTITSEFKKETSSIQEFYIGENKSLIDYELNSKNSVVIIELISPLTFTIIDSLDFNSYYDILNEKLKNYCSFDFVGNKNIAIKNLEIDFPKMETIDDLKNTLSKNKTTIFTQSSQTVKNFLEYNSINEVEIKEVSLNVLKSFSISPSTTKERGLGGEVFLCDDIISKVFTKKRIRKNLSADLDLLLKITPGDYIVHIEHGIGIFKQIVKKELSGIIKEYIEIEYANDDKLFVPITEVSRVNKYLGVEKPKLTGLNTTEWARKLKKASEDVEQIASELLEIYANRKINLGFNFLGDKTKEDAFKNSFPYIYTEDQAKTIEEVLNDMSKPIPMDRLIVGDVGFGKTEIAFNAIYRAFINKKQSILIAPLVVLAYEHYEKALDRFRNTGMRIGILTRLESVKNANQTIKKLQNGELDLIVGTHKLLSDSIIFKDLGLIVVDEEHKFGVGDKEKIKSYKTTIDVLSMSATPIPRSLNMALSSLKEISILKNAPYGRQNIQTIISRYYDNVILEAGIREFERGGQMFFVHNRVSNIENFKKLLENIFPDKKIVVTHGQLPGDQLEKRIIDFKHKKYDILLSTTVIENGIDFSNVNTMIINDAEKFGLSQIHQLRGRVGRSDKKGYCYLLYKKENLKEDTAKRLKTIVEYSYLGAGFELAMKDLEIRGGGDLLGFRQSGQVSEIGVNLFLKMVEEKIEELSTSSQPSPLEEKEQKQLNSPLPQGRGVRSEGKIDTKIDLNISLSIPDEYFASELDKINFYREIESVNDIEELEGVIEDFKLINSKLPPEAQNLFDMLKMKIYASSYKIINIKKVGINYQIDFEENTTLEELKRFLDLDKEVRFTVINLNRLRSSIKSFANIEKFLKYLLQLFEGNIKNNKIKLKKKV
ncbi:MAG: CarD family transcriptional regulator [Candidatus Gracilibacteria bacterium]|nr:CarD family transcriptional regulator [Candidatus Gracilibacteria bacterium]